MSVDVVYSKTEAGRSEFARRSLGLNGRQRSILVMVDGHRGCAELAMAMPDGVVEGVLAELLARGLIVAAADAAAADAAAVDTAAASPVDPHALARLAGVKRQMTGAADAYLGLMASALVRRIEGAADAPALAGVIGHWHMALQDSKHGKAVALELLEQVRAGLAGAGA